MKTSNEDGPETPLFHPIENRGRPVPKSELRKQARERAFEKAEKSDSLAVRYPGLKTLTVNQLYFDREIVSWGHGLLYRANLQAARSLLHFHCPSTMCNGGGFDLSNQLSSAVTEHRKCVEGKVRCKGSRDQESGKAIPCESVLHFKMNLTFKTRAVATNGARVRKPGKKSGRSRFEFKAPIGGDAK